MHPPNTLCLWQNLLRSLVVCHYWNISYFIFVHTLPDSTYLSSLTTCIHLTIHTPDPQTAPHLKCWVRRSSNYTAFKILIKYWLYWSSNGNCFETLKNISESSSTFHSPSRGDCSIFLCVIFKRFTFSCSKKEWPAGRPARGETIDLDTVTLLPSMPSCAQSFWHPLRRAPHD